MKNSGRNQLYAAAGMLASFALWTLLLKLVDVQPIGPMNTEVGFARLNSFVHNLTGTHMLLYDITDLLGFVPLACVGGFGLLGLYQWISRKDIRRVDRSLLILGGFYITVFALYLLFEIYIVNYRPILIDGQAEASYPSSTTVLVLCVMPTVLMQLKARIHGKFLRRIISMLVIAFIFFMLLGRLVSGVHWLSDIIGGILLSTGLVSLYRYAAHRFT